MHTQGPETKDISVFRSKSYLMQSYNYTSGTVLGDKDAKKR